jgi:hypothetical protein
MIVDDVVIDSDKYDVVLTSGNIEGKIEPKTLNIETIKVPSIYVNGLAEDTITGSDAFTSNDIVTIGEGEDAAADKVTITYKRTVESTAAAGTVAAAISEAAIDGDERAVANYTLGTVPETADLTIQTKSSGGGGGGSSSQSIIVKETQADGTTKVITSAIKGKAGETKTIAASFTTYIKNTGVTWSSSDESIVKVNENGELEFIAPGEAEITAVSDANGKISKTIKVTVEPGDVVATEEPAATATPNPVVSTEYSSAYVNGYEDGSFGPEKTITREEVSTMFARIIADSIELDKSYDSSFPDVTSADWSKNYIGYLEQFKIVNGYEDGTFKPKANITRAEMAVMIARAEGLDLTGVSTKTQFTDISSVYDSWATPAIKVLAEQGVITGYEDGTFRPSQSITRAETVAMINRMLKAGEVETIKVRPTDVKTSHWAYDDVIKAMNDRILKAAADSNSEEAAEATEAPETTESPEASATPEASTTPEASATPEASTAPTATPKA